MKIISIFSGKLTLTLALLLLTIILSSITSKKHKSSKTNKVSKTHSSHKKTNLKSKSRSRSNSKNQPTCPYDEDNTIELLKKVLDFLKRRCYTCIYWRNPVSESFQCCHEPLESTLNK